jgi:hypothetical protein
MFFLGFRVKLKEVADLQFWKLPAFRPPLPVPAQYSPARSLSLGFLHGFPPAKGGDLVFFILVISDCYLEIILDLGFGDWDFS